jgi:hypothetical protein
MFDMELAGGSPAKARKSREGAGLSSLGWQGDVVERRHGTIGDGSGGVMSDERRAIAAACSSSWLGGWVKHRDILPIVTLAGVAHRGDVFFLTPPTRPP